VKVEDEATSTESLIAWDAEYLGMERREWLTEAVDMPTNCEARYASPE
jgi:hypothetical protein